MTDNSAAPQITGAPKPAQPAAGSAGAVGCGPGCDQSVLGVIVHNETAGPPGGSSGSATSCGSSGSGCPTPAPGTPAAPGSGIPLGPSNAGTGNPGGPGHGGGAGAARLAGSGSTDPNATQSVTGGPKLNTLDPNQSPNTARGPPAPGSHLAQGKDPSTGQGSLARLFAPGARLTPATAGAASTQQDLTRLFTPGAKSAPSGTTANSAATNPQNDQPPFTQLLHPVPGNATAAGSTSDADPRTDTLGRPPLPGQAAPYPSNHTLSNAYTTANDWLDQHSLPNLIRKAQGELPVAANTGKLGQINSELRGAVGGLLDAGPNMAIATVNEMRRDPGQLTSPSLFPGSQIVAPALKANGPNQAAGVAQTGKDIKGRYGPMLHGDVHPFVRDYQDHPVRAALEDVQVPLTLVPIGRSIVGFAARGAAEAAAAREATAATNNAARGANAGAARATPDSEPAAGLSKPPTEKMGPTGPPAENRSESGPQTGGVGAPDPHAAPTPPTKPAAGTATSNLGAWPAGRRPAGQSATRPAARAGDPAGTGPANRPDFVGGRHPGGAADAPLPVGGTNRPQLGAPKTTPRTGAAGAPSLTEHLNSVLPPHRGVPADQLGLNAADRQALPHALRNNPNYTYFEHSGTGFVRRTPLHDSVHVTRPPDSNNMGRWGDNAKKAAEAQAAEDPDGVVYLRTNKDGGKYVGRAKNQDRFAARQKEHGRANPDAGYRFKELGRAKSGKDLQRAEQENIDTHGGPKNKSNPNGSLENKRNEVSPKKKWW